MKKRIAIYGALAILLAGYVGFFALVEFWHDVTKANFDQLEIGMTKSQVRSVLGFGPDDTHHWVKGQVHEDWRGKDGAILLAFDDQNRLVWKDWVPEWGRSRPTLGERIDDFFVRTGIIKIRE